jgi:hypothetical protein
MKQSHRALAAAARRFSIVAAVLAPIALCAQPAAASTACTGVNGTETLPGTDLGAIPSGGCTIGTFFTPPGASNSSPAHISPNTHPAYNPSLYEFSWGGGLMTIQVEVGNNGYGYDTDFELGLASGNSIDTGGSLLNHVASNYVPYASGPNGPVYLLENIDLAAGEWILDTYIGSCSANYHGGDCSYGTFGADPDDPNFMVKFTPGPTPLPAALPLFGTGLGALGLVVGRRRRKVVVA